MKANYELSSERDIYNNRNSQIYSLSAQLSNNQARLSNQQNNNSFVSNETIKLNQNNDMLIRQEQELKLALESNKEQQRINLELTEENKHNTELYIQDSNLLNDTILKIDHSFSSFSAVYKKEENKTERICKFVDVSTIKYSGIIFKQIQNHSIDEFDITISNIDDINYLNHNGQSIIMHAAIHGFGYAVHKLIEMGADINIIDNHGRNLLLYISDMPSPNIDIDDICFIIDNTTYFYQKDPITGNTATHNFINYFHYLISDTSSEIAHHPKGQFIEKIFSSIWCQGEDFCVQNNNNETVLELIKQHDLSVFNPVLFDKLDHITDSHSMHLGEIDLSSFFTN